MTIFIKFQFVILMMSTVLFMAPSQTLWGQTNRSVENPGPIRVPFRNSDQSNPPVFKKASDPKFGIGDTFPGLGDTSSPASSTNSAQPGASKGDSANPAVDEKMKPQADVGAAAAKPETQPRSSASTGNQKGNETEPSESEKEDDEEKPWKLFQPRYFEMGGWSQTGYHSRSDGMFNNFSDHFQQHQMWFFAEKKADGEKGLDLGFRIDYLWGTDGPDTQAFGNPAGFWDVDWDNGQFYGHAIPQLYGEVAHGDISVKVGHFFTPVGYEVVQAPANFFYSHSYTMYNAEPFTHSGALATIGMGDVTGYAGWTNGWDTGFAGNGGSTFLGGGTLNLTEDHNVTYIATIGKIGNGTDQRGYSHSIVSNRKLTESLSWISQSDLVDFEGTVSPDRKAFGINNYLLYTINSRWSAGTRFEWWRPEVAPGNDEDLYGLTLGLNCKPGTNMIIRPEVRWNRDDFGLLIPTADNNRFGFGCDMIVTF